MQQSFLAESTSKYSRLENGPDPALNIKLEHLIERAKATNMTKDKIESAVKSGVKVDVIYLELTLACSVGSAVMQKDTKTYYIFHYRE